jgi:hypothetical protein
VVGNFRYDSANIDNIRTFPSKVVFDSYNNSQLRKESKEFKGIVQFYVIDSYGNLTNKTLSGLKWAVFEQFTHESFLAGTASFNLLLYKFRFHID